MVRLEGLSTILSIALLSFTAAITPQKTSAATGQQLVFTAYLDDNAKMEIYVLDAASGRVQNLTKNAPGSQTNPAWSPDGKYIAYISALPSSRDEYHIAVMDVATGDTRILATNGRKESEPTWSPDGKQIAYWSYDKGGAGIYIVSSDSGKAQRLGDIAQGGALQLSWSPDGTHLMYTSIDGLYTVNVEDSTATNLTINKDQGTCCIPAGAGVWSPDGRQIAFVANWDGKGLQIYTMNADGSNPHPVVAQTGWQIAPAWFPDGKHLAFIFESDGRDKSGQLYSVQVDGNGLTQLTEPMETYLPQISPDGSQIAFMVSKGLGSQNHSQTDLYLTTLGQSQPTQLTHGEYHDISRLAWRPIPKP